MLLPFFIARNLDKKVKDNIKNKNYNVEELKQIYRQILKNYEEDKKNFMINAIIFLLVFGFMAYKAMQIRDFMIPGILICICFYLMTMGIFYINLTNSKRIFTNLVKKNYPEEYEDILR